MCCCAHMFTNSVESGSSCTMSLRALQSEMQADLLCCVSFLVFYSAGEIFFAIVQISGN